MQDILINLITHINQIRMYHWKTFIHSRHIATDKYMDKVNPIIDTIIETLQGKRGMRIKDSFKIEFFSMTDKNAEDYLFEHQRWLENDFEALVDENETDILNLRDELLSAVSQLIYLFTLK